MTSWSRRFDEARDDDAILKIIFGGGVMNSFQVG